MDMIAAGVGGSGGVAGSRTRSAPCPACGRDFEVRRHGRFCSDACRARNWKQARLDFTPAASELAHAVRGRETKAARILARLQQGPANSLELARVGGLRYSARVFELRRQGHRITTEEHADFAVYRLEEGA